jgi:hypothetical protein
MRLHLITIALALCATASLGERAHSARAPTPFSSANRTVGSSTTLHSTASNCGDASFTFTGVSVHAATGPDYRVDSTCTTGQTLAPGGDVQH